ncbi:MAG: RNB domain-containing ribonuclease, partial [Bacilli bacterium]|nr:RNB domain-containing ribonuclease [Bacilli bacterium]
KMTYEDVDEIIMNNNMVPGYEKFEKSLYILYDAAVRLEKRYTSNGKVEFAETETNKTYNSDGTINSVSDPVCSLARKIIENLMIAANETVANWFISLDIPTVFRVHEIPDINKVNEAIEKLNQNGYKIKPIKDIDDPKALQILLNILESYPEYPIISSLLVMTMQRAGYSTHNLGHYALGLPAYLHFTSPIRRLADLLVHYLIDLVFDQPELLTPEYLRELEDWLEDLCKRASMMERQAEMAELIGERRGILKSLNKNTIYEANVIEIGRRIKLRLNGIETYINAKELNSILGYNTKRKKYYDIDTGANLRIGSKLYVKVTSIDPVNDNFNVKVIDIVKENVKTRTKKKQ